jgi:hypothetical protein
VRRDEEATAALRAGTRTLGCFWRRVPELPQDIHDLDGLARVADALFEGKGGDGDA